MADKYTPERATSGKERLRTWWKKVENNFVKIFGAVSKHIDGTADRHTADMIDYSDTETVKAKLDSTDAELNTKVDKVSGKSLIDSGVARSLNKQAGGIVYNASKDAFTVGDVSDGGGVMSDMNGNVTYTFGSYAKITSYDVEVKKARNPVHRLSEKANTSDVFLKSGDVVLADGKKVSLSSSESGNDGTLTIRPTGISLSRDTSMGTNDVAVSAYSGISVGGYGVDISINTIDGEQHKLSEKADKAEVFLPTKDIALESGKKISITNSNDTMAATLSGEELKIAEKDNDYKYARISANDVEVKTYYTDETNDPVFVTHKLSEKVNASDVGALSALATTNKSSIVAAINEVKASGGGDVLDNLTYDSTNDIINSSANLLLENSASVAAYNGTFRGDIKIGQLGANKWAYTISPITGFSTSVDVTCTSGNVVHNLSAKADTTNVLTRNNTQTFTPTGDYQPATKKYVDDTIKAAIEKYNTEAMALLGED